LSRDESDIPGVIGRRSARLSIIVPITVRGTDTSGQTFKENTWTINVNKHGGRLATFHQLAANDLIVIENPLLGRVAKGRIIRVCEKHFPEDPYEMCVELLEAQNVWGVKLPPENWQKERQIVRGEQKSPTPQAAPQSQKTPAATAGNGGDSETPHLAPQASPAEVGEHTGGLSQFNMVVTALSRFAGEATAPPSQPASLEQNGMGVPKAPAGHSETPDSLALTPLQEKINEAQSLRQELTALVDHVQSARAEVESLLLKAQEAWRDWTSQAVEVARKMEEASAKRLQSALASLDQDVEQRLASASTRLAGETYQRWQAEAAGIVENVAKEVGDRLSPLAQESLSKATLDFQAQRNHAAEQARAELDELVKDATTIVEARIRKVKEEVSSSLRAQFERSAEQVAGEQLEEFKVQIETARRSSEDSTRHNIERMRQETKAEILNAGIQAGKIYKEESATAAKAISVFVDSAVDSLNRAGDEAATKLQAACEAVEVSLKKAAEEHLTQLAGESASMLEKFRAQTQALASHLQSEVESAARDLSEKAQRDISEKLEGTVEGALELVARDFNKQAEDSLEMLKEGLRSAQEQCVDETRKQLAAARESTLASLASEAGAKSASLRDQLHASLLEMQEQQTKEMETIFQISLQGFLETLRTEVQLATTESVARATAEATTGFERALQELLNRVYKGVGMAALVVKEWEDEGRTRLETHSRQALEAFQKQLEGLTVAAQERQRSEAEALTGLLGSCLHQAARLFEGLEAEAAQSKGVAREESRNSPFQPLQQPTDPLRLALEPLVEKQQRIVDEALNAFRSRLSQILADQTPKEQQGPAGVP
jgi:hypothetical protein